MNLFDRVSSHLSDAHNELGELNDDVTDERLLDYASRLKTAIEVAMQTTGEASDYAEMDYEQVAYDRHIDMLIDEAKGK